MAISEKDKNTDQASTGPIDLENFEPPQVRADKFKEKFSQESEYTRSLILKDISALHHLLQLGATTIPELVLANTAREQGELFDPNHPPKLKCPRCGSSRTGLFTGEENLYRCYQCEHKFAGNFQSLTSQSHLSLLTWQKIVHCILSGDTVASACKKCDIKTAGTFLRARLRIFYAIHIYFERHPIRLSGKIQCDETFPPISYKGYNLKRTKLFSPEDEKYPQRQKPRKAKERGGTSKDEGVNASKLCLFAAATERASFVCYCGIGQPSVSVLQHYVPKEIFLDTVPEQDDFPYNSKKLDIELTDKPGDTSRYLCDGSPVMKKFGEKCLGFNTNSRVYRKNGVQRKLPKAEADLHIQRVNNLHGRIRRFLREANCSSRYIKGQLLVFNFITNTGGLENQEAANELMRILVEPGLGKSQAFLEDMFATLPNALLEWRTQDNVISKLPEKNVTAAFLLDKILHPENHPEDDFTEPLTVRDIIEITGLKQEDIYAIFRDYTEAGLMPKILDYQYGRLDGEEEKQAKQQQRRQLAIDSITAMDLLLFDKYAQNRTLPAHERASLRELCDEINQEHGTNYEHQKAFHLFEKIEKHGLREKQPPLNSCKRTIYTYTVFDFGFVLIREYLELVGEKEASGQKFSSKREVFDILASRYPQYSRGKVLNDFRLAVLYIQHMSPEWGLPVAPIEERKKQFRTNIEPKERRKLPSAHELFNIAVECACEDYIAFCASAAYSDATDEEFLEVLLGQYNIRHISINTFRARLLHWSQAQSAPSAEEAQNIGRVYGMSVSTSATKTLRVYERIVQEYLERGEKKPPFNAVIEKVQKEVPLAPYTLKKNLALAHAYQRLVHPQTDMALKETAPPPDISKFRFRKGPRVFGRSVPNEAFKTMAVYERIVQEYRADKSGMPAYWVLLEEVQEEIPLSLTYLRSHISMVSRYREEGADDISDVHLKIPGSLLEIMFEAYAEYRQTHYKEKEEERAFFAELIEKHQVDVAPNVLKQYLLSVSESSAHASLPRFLPKSKYAPPVSKKAYITWAAYLNLVHNCEETGQEIPSYTEAAKILSKELPYARNSILNHLLQVRSEGLQEEPEDFRSYEQMSLWQ